MSNSFIEEPKTDKLMQHLDNLYFKAKIENNNSKPRIGTFFIQYRHTFCSKLMIWLKKFTGEKGTLSLFQLFHS